MTEDAFDILKKALALPAESRAAIADSLLQSLDQDPSDVGIAEAWSEEIKRRLEEIDPAAVQLIPYEEVRRRLMARLSDARK